LQLQIRLQIKDFGAGPGTTGAMIRIYGSAESELKEIIYGTATLVFLLKIGAAGILNMITGT
jgi:hypothetical protein